MAAGNQKQFRTNVLVQFDPATRRGLVVPT